MLVFPRDAFVVLSDDNEFEIPQIQTNDEGVNQDTYNIGKRPGSILKTNQNRASGWLHGLHSTGYSTEVSRKKRRSEAMQPAAKRRISELADPPAALFMNPLNATQTSFQPEKKVSGHFLDNCTRNLRNIDSTNVPVTRPNAGATPATRSLPESLVVVLDSDDDDDESEFSAIPEMPRKTHTSIDVSEEDLFHDATQVVEPITAYDTQSGNSRIQKNRNGEGGQGCGKTASRYDDNSDDDIAILSKEEAERVGTFKKSSFEHQQTSVSPSSSSYNQPPPVFHTGAPSPPQQQPHSIPIATSADITVRNYFMNYSVPQLQEYERNLELQLGLLQEQTNSCYAEVQDARTKILMLPFDQTTLKEQLNLFVTEKLRLAEALLENTKKTRNYRYILDAVKNLKLARRTGQTSSIYRNNDSGFGSTVNPYMMNSSTVATDMGQAAATARLLNDDHVHLENLFKDLCREEKIEGMAPTPDSLSIQLLSHQRRGLFWLLEKEKARLGCILADDMGLGKTVQTLAVMMANPPRNPACKTTLIVGPVSLLRQWDAEIKAKIKPAHSLKTAFFHGLDKRQLATFQNMAVFDVVLTSYTTLASEFKQHFGLEIERAQVTQHQNVIPLRGTGGQSYMSPFYSSDATFYRVVLDEAQSIRNKLSQASKAVACLRGQHRLCLTGTPMQNNIDELYPILRFLESRPYDDEKKFKMDILVPLRFTSDNFDDYDRNQSMKKLRAVLLAIMLRRTKDSQVGGKPLIELPAKIIDRVFVTMENDELEYYNALEKGIQKTARKLLSSATKSRTTPILTLLLRLRQACIHQLLVEVGEFNSYENSDTFQGRNWVQMYKRALAIEDENVKATVRELLGEEDRDDLFLRDFSIYGEALPKREGQTGVEPGIDAEAKAQFTCPVCFDVGDEDLIVVFANCGHMVCDGCVSNLFQSEDHQDVMHQVARCVTCGVSTTQTDLIEYQMFVKVCYERADFTQLERLYGMSTTKKTTNSEKVNFLIRRDKGFTPSAKMERTLDLIKKITQGTPDEKIIVFSHFTVTFDLMGYALEQENIPFLRYDGSMNIDDKNKTVSEFYQSSCRILLISLKAGNVGLTLTCASHVVIMDPFWNPYVEDQAMDRAHRFGQERPVKVYRLLIKNSVEDRIIDLQQRKKELVGSALDENSLKSSSHLGRRELGYLFGLNSLQG